MIESKDREDRLVRANMGLVITIAKSFKPKDRNEYDELIQIGSIGLLKAIRKHDPKKGALSTIAWPYIYYSILRYFKQQYANPHEVLFDDAAKCETQAELWEFLPPSLTDLERQVLTLKIEFNWTFEEIGKQIGGYTRGWANKLYKSAIKKIRIAHE